MVASSGSNWHGSEERDAYICLVFHTKRGESMGSPLLHGRKPRANTCLAFIPFVKSLCESEILEREDGASLGGAAMLAARLCCRHSVVCDTSIY